MFKEDSRGWQKQGASPQVLCDKGHPGLEELAPQERDVEGATRKKTNSKPCVAAKQCFKLGHCDEEVTWHLE